MANYEELRGLVEEVKDLLSTIEEADAKGKFAKAKSQHNPFRWVKKGKAIGPGPRGRENRKKGYWSCKCAGYRCLCKGSEGERKRVVIGRAYKQRYNVAYRKWRAKHAARYTYPGAIFGKKAKAK